jgi:hypothetical protein
VGQLRDPGRVGRLEVDAVLHQPGRRRRRGRLVHHPAGLGLGNQPDPGTVHLNGQLVQCRRDTGEAVVAGPPQLRRELGQLLDHGVQEPGRVQLLAHHQAFEHMSSLPGETTEHNPAQ